MPHRPLYLAVLAAVAGLILALGWRARPPDTTVPPVTETDVSMLARLTERRTLESMPRLFAELAASVENGLAWLPADATSGVIWSPGQVLVSPAGAADITFDVRVNTITTTARATAWASGFWIAALKVPGASAATPHRQTPLTAGEWLVVVWAADQGAVPPFAPGHFVQPATRPCGGDVVEELVTTVPLRTGMSGGGIFDLNGELSGMVVSCTGTAVAIGTNAIERWLERADDTTERLRARYGLTVAAADSEVAGQHASEIIVRQVTIGSAADRAGIAPGDVIVAINDRPVTVVHDLSSLAPLDAAPASLQLVRGSSTVVVTLPTPGGDVGSGDNEPSADDVQWDPARRSYHVIGMSADSKLARAGISPGDVIVAIDRVQPRSAGQLRLALASRRPARLEVVRGGERLAFTVGE